MTYGERLVGEFTRNAGMAWDVTKDVGLAVYDTSKDAASWMIEETPGNPWLSGLAVVAAVYLAFGPGRAFVNGLRVNGMPSATDVASGTAGVAVKGAAIVGAVAGLVLAYSAMMALDETREDLYQDPVEYNATPTPLPELNF
jgi:hypothetical protein